MPMYDSVFVKCPRCGASIELQSKSGPCACIDYPSNAVPRDVFADLDHEAICPGCGRLVRITVVPPVTTVEIVAVV